MDVYGEGVLITGESGIGKSEAALELIKRGHRLVTDDVVEIRKVSDDTLIGTAPDITKHFIELRGIGIVDVKTLFGVSSVKDTQNIDLVIRLEDWDKDKEYDRLGLEEEYTEYLGNKIVCHNIPIRPGRNLHGASFTFSQRMISAVNAEVAFFVISSGTSLAIAISRNKGSGCSSRQNTMPGISQESSFV